MLTGLITALVILVVCVLVGAFIVQIATKLAAGFKPSLGNAVATVLVGLILGGIINYLLGMVIGSSGQLIGLVVAFLVNAFIINMMIKAPGGQMGFGKACLVSLIQYVIYIVLAVVLFFLVGGAIFSMMGAGAVQ
jgi:hypothetical protein